MIGFIFGVLVGAIGFFLILDNNPKLAEKMKVYKALAKEKIKKEQEQNKG